MRTILWWTICVLMLQACHASRTNSSVASKPWWQEASEEELLDSVQVQTFRFFWDFAEPVSGLARERYHPTGVYPMEDSHIVTSGGTGFGLMAMIVGIERGFISRREGVERLMDIVDFLEQADRFHGAWSHWINGKTGRVKPFSKKDDGGDLVETSFLAAGLLCIRQYCNKDLDTEKKLREKVDQLWRSIEWNWYTNQSDDLFWHWSPNHHWEMNFALRGYNETLITHVLAASSPTHPTDPRVYHHCWARDGNIRATDQYYGLDRILDHYPTNDSPVGPLFWAHYSHLGLDPRNLKDQYGDYWLLNKNHTLAHYRHCVENPHDFVGYGPDCWGLTSSYSPKNGTIGYSSHRPDRDIGVISPTAAVSSIPYTPEESMAAIRSFFGQYGTQLVGPAGFYDAFRPADGWVAPRYLAIDQGPIIVMIENYRTGLLWDLFMSCPEVQAGLTKLGFTWK